MNAPFYQLDGFSYPTAMALATLLGIGFGFVLERSGFARAPVLAAQFYGRDNRILKVMFTAVATAVVGVALLSGLGLLDLAAVKIPATWLYPQLVGGFLLGVGFLMAGYCPGTAVTGVGAGYLDPFLSLVGLGIGGLVFGFAFPLVEPFYESSSMGVITLPELLHVSWAVLAVAVVAMAIGAFLLAEKVERIFAKKDGTEVPAGNARTRNRVFGGLAAAAAAVVVVGFAPKPAQKIAAMPETGKIGVTELARQLAGGTEELYMVDARSAKECEAQRIPGALCIPEDDPDAKFIAQLPATRPLVLYGDEKLGKLPAGVAKFKGSVKVLEGGFSAWKTAILQPPKPPTTATAVAVSTYRERAALHAHFTGASAPKAPAVVVAPTAVKRAVKKGGGC